jgi:hypothetical protein
MYSSFLEEGIVFDQRRVETSCSVRRNQHDVLEVFMDGHLVPASSNSKFHCSLENFTLDAERWLAPVADLPSARSFAGREQYGNILNSMFSMAYRKC